MSETRLSNQIRVEASKLGCRLFRNQVGTYALAKGGFLSSGLCVGSSDNIGWKSVVVTPEMVGKRVAIFTAVEVKTSRGTTSKEQHAFIEAARQAGAIAFVARSVEEAMEGLSGETGL